MAKTKIEWADDVLNSVTGCTKISEGCAKCYMFRVVKWQQRLGSHKYRNGTKLTLHPEVIEQPLRWKKGRKIFVNSMSDFFHEDVPFEFIKKSFDIFNKTTHHTYQILTKRSDILKKYSPFLGWTRNIWMGVSVELQKYEYRIDDLIASGASNLFLSLEPLLGPLKIEKYLETGEISWVIVGGESDHDNPRVMSLVWVDSLKDQCKKYNVPFFFKQIGGRMKCKCHDAWGCRLLEGKTYDEYPEEKLIDIINPKALNKALPKWL